MRVRIQPGGSFAGVARVPGDKSIAHRWILLAATATSPSELRDVPAALDVASSAQIYGRLTEEASLLGWAEAVNTSPAASGTAEALRTSGVGRHGFRHPGTPLDCGNSGTTLRLAMGVLASAAFEVSLTGDASLRTRPMERIAEPLRHMGATIETSDGHAPVMIGPPQAGLRGIEFALPVASSQLKSAVLLAGVAADGSTTVVDAVGTRDHTERALLALGYPVVFGPAGEITVERSEHQGFHGAVPGDPSSAAFLIAGAALAGSELTIERVGLNPTRIAFLDVMRDMGVEIACHEEDVSVGEPSGTITVSPRSGPLRGVTVISDGLAAVVDEVPILAALAAYADGESRFEGAGELRLKESNRLDGVCKGIDGLGGDAAIEGDNLVIAGGGLHGGHADSLHDHRLAMSFVVMAAFAREPSTVSGLDSAAVSFPGFAEAVQALGLQMEPA